MSTATIHIHEQAQEELNSLSNDAVRRIKRKLREMVENRFRELSDYDVERVKRHATPFRRARVGDWRVFFQVRNRGYRVLILGVSRRKTAYDSTGHIASRAKAPMASSPT